jgi:hypothetical protein
MLDLLSEREREASALAAVLVVTETVAIDSERPSLLSVVMLDEEESRRGSILPSHFGPFACDINNQNRSGR